jgi:hypothetical protein
MQRGGGGGEGWAARGCRHGFAYGLHVVVSSSPTPPPRGVFCVQVV